MKKRESMFFLICRLQSPLYGIRKWLRVIISRSSGVFRNVFIIRYIIRHNGGRNRPFSRHHALYSVMSALTLYQDVA